MRMLMLSFSLFCYSFASCSQNITSADVPSVVKNALLTQYADAMHVEWEKEKDLYEAEFEINQTEYSALFDASGKMVLVKTEIPAAEIPAAVQATISQKYQNKKIEDAEKIEKHGQVFYEVELDGKLFGKEIVLNQDGTIAQNQNF